MSTPATQKKEVTLTVGQQHLSQDIQEVLKAVRITSGIVLVVYDPETKWGGMAHMALPDSKIAQPSDTPLKFVDKGIPAFMDAMQAKNMALSSLIVNVVGGSQLFNFGGGGANLLNIGMRNVVTTRTLLSRSGIQIHKTETGGNKPRTVALHIATGATHVVLPGQEPRLL